MEINSPIKKNETMKFLNKLRGLKSTILSEVTQTQKDKYSIYSLIVDICS